MVTETTNFKLIKPLQMSVMELSSYAATKDERLQTQENAVMELSMLVAGGGA